MEDFAKAGFVGIGLGIGIALAAPFIGGDRRERRRILKGVLRTYFDVAEGLREQAAEAGERFSDLLAEVQVEREATRAAEAALPTSIAGRPATNGSGHSTASDPSGQGSQIHSMNEMDRREPPGGA